MKKGLLYKRIAPMSFRSLVLISCVIGTTAQSSIKTLMAGHRHAAESPTSAPVTCSAGENYVPSADKCIPSPTMYTCPSNEYVTGIQTSSGGDLSITSIKCSDGSEIVVDVNGTSSSAGVSSSTNEDGFCGYLSSLNSNSDGEYVAQLQFVDCGSGDLTDTYTYSNTADSLPVALTNVTCGDGAKAIGVAVSSLQSSQSSNLMAAFDLICGSITDSETTSSSTSDTCACQGGVPGLGAKWCFTCLSCSAHYNLVPSDSSRCFPAPKAFRCPYEDTFITDISIGYNVLVTSIWSFTCSDSSVVIVDTYDAPDPSTAPPTFSSEAGFCSVQSTTFYESTTQFKLTDCAGNDSDTIGDFVASGPTTTTVNTCPENEVATGLTYSKIGASSAGGGINLNLFEFLCGVPSASTVSPSSAPSVSPTLTPTIAPTFLGN